MSDMRTVTEPQATAGRLEHRPQWVWKQGAERAGSRAEAAGAQAVCEVNCVAVWTKERFPSGAVGWKRISQASSRYSEQHAL